MSPTVSTESEVHTFHARLGKLLDEGEAPRTPEECVSEFRRYRETLEECRDVLADARAGESHDLDVGSIRRRVRTELAARGGISE